MTAKLPARRLCTAITRSGKPCQAPPTGGTKPPRCLMHQPGKASLMGMLGGKRRTVFSPEGLASFTPPESAADLLPLIAASIVELREARLEPKLAQALSSLVNGFLSTLQLSDHEARIKTLEARHESRK